MAGLAALLSFGSDRTTTQTLAALSEALAPRGDGEVIVGHGPARLLVRAGMPKVFEADGNAIIVDGMAELSSLLSRYQRQGPQALISGPNPYALILADSDGLVLARNLDGPPLYYARSRGAVMVASEPTALLAAGIAAKPNDAAVARFLATGACDEVAATFFEGIRRVLPGQVVEVSRHAGSGGQADGWAIRAHPPLAAKPSRASGRMALLGALGDERTGVVMLGAGQQDVALPTAAMLGAALAERETHRAVPVYSSYMPGQERAHEALLGPISEASIRHRALPLYTDEIDVDGFMIDLGEPVPGLAAYLLWAMARACGGEVDTLLTAIGWRGPAAHLSRLSDRIAARYGLTLRFPYRELDGSDPNARAELQALAERTLPHASMRAAVRADGLEPALPEVLQRLRPELATTLLYPKHGTRDDAALARLCRLGRASDPDLDRLWRHYVLERWLSVVVRPERVAVPASRPAPEAIVAGRWQRHLIGTEQLGPQERIAEKIAWYVAEFVNTAAKPTRLAMRHPWYLMIVAKSMAVAAGRAIPVWTITPGRLAGLLAKAANGTRHPDPWSMQVAIDEAGGMRMGLAVACARLGKRSWYDRVSGVAAVAVSPPRENACPPGNLAVIPQPVDGDRSAAEIVSALRRLLPDEVAQALGGCAIVGVDATGVTQYGWDGSAEPAPELLAKLCADNPFGQGDERTPLLVATMAGSRQGAQQPGRKGGRRQPAKRR
ncbi:hypothetical protein Rhe02_62590 [Rhizocola hellebori]|uniref:Glutamine amidotransferase type-2 domain-containing protein n=1 Tax=Rhizocola hellebori TaxID=1392758 RepID=A0A8J3QDT6_9ACTN|nr:hypothetical protein [Rhizocola hellebori]GIH08192.1 hypothetical protein Rhe02_62590 [Rhizocola hellebori]